MIGLLFGIVLGITLYTSILRLYLLLDWHFFYKKFRNKKIQFDKFGFMIDDNIINGIND